MFVHISHISYLDPPLLVDAQIQAAAEYQRRLRQRRRIYYIIMITGVTMITFSILW